MDEYALASAMRMLAETYYKNSRKKPKTFVIASNEMHKVKFSDNSYVAICQNTQSRGPGNSGLHWLLWLSNGSGTVEYFDSLGMAPSSYKVEIPRLTLVKANIGIVLQPEGSDKCALYCLYMFYNRLIGREYESILSDFKAKRSLYRNDLTVQKFYNKLCFNCPQFPPQYVD
jgi:hypothetical protein